MLLADYWRIQRRIKQNAGYTSAEVLRAEERFSARLETQTEDDDEEKLKEAIADTVDELWLHGPGDVLESRGFNAATLGSQRLNPLNDLCIGQRTAFCIRGDRGLFGSAERVVGGGV